MTAIRTRAEAHKDIPANELQAWLRQAAAPQGAEFDWHDGAPPHVGWWCASRTGIYEHWRWWNGSRWSAPAHQKDSPAEAARAARTPADVHVYPIRWCLHWPQNARAIRLDPYNAAMRGRLPALDVWADEPRGLWNTGAPPHIGWWNASTHPRQDIWRWWDGVGWSMPAHENDPLEKVAQYARIQSGLALDAVRWTRRWPKSGPRRVNLSALAAKAFERTLPAPGTPFSCIKKPMPLCFTRAPRSEVVRTLEGAAHARAGDAILTGTMGERWPVPWKEFSRNYQYNTNTGVCVKKPLVVQATQRSEAFSVTRANGDVLHGQAGDFEMNYANRSVGVVRKDIFLQTYRRA